MQDGILKGTGNSRYLKSVASFLSLYPTYEDFAQALIEGTLPIDLNGINEAGWAQLGTALTAGNLLSDATAEKLGLGPVEKVDKPLREYAEGDIVYLKEDGVLTPFIVAKHNYESDLNGAGRTLLVRKGAAGVSAWNEAGVNTYADSTIDTLLNSEYKAKLPADVQAALAETTFYYTVGGGDTTVTTLSRAVFLLSDGELRGGLTDGTLIDVLANMQWASVYGLCGWTRSPNGTEALTMSSTGFSGTAVSRSSVYCPIFTLPESFTPAAYWLTSGGGATDEAQSTVTPTNALERLWRGTPILSATVVDGDASSLAIMFSSLEGGHYKVYLDGNTMEPTKTGIGLRYTGQNTKINTSSIASGAFYSNSGFSIPTDNGCILDVWVETTRTSSPQQCYLFAESAPVFNVRYYAMIEASASSYSPFIAIDLPFSTKYTSIGSRFTLYKVED